MEQFKSELRQLLTRYPQVKSVSFDVTETVTAQVPMFQMRDASMGNVPVMPPLGSTPPNAAVAGVLADLTKK